MSATASIQTDRKDNIISIPVQTITTRKDLYEDTLVNKSSEELAEQVFVVKEDNTLEIREVKTGIQDITNIEIISGLKEGEKIVNGPYSAISKTLKSGSKVTADG